MDKVFTLLDLQKSIRDADTLDKFGFAVVNQTKKIIDYDLGLFWNQDGLKPKFKALSGNKEIDENGPFTQELYSILDKYKAKSSEGGSQAFDYNGQYYLHHGFSLRDKTPLAGLLLQRSKAFVESDIEILNELGAAYSYSYNYLAHGKCSFSFLPVLQKLRTYIFIGILLACFLPVSLSIHAPAEIVSQKSIAVTAPIDGTIQEVLVEPSSSVEVDQSLILLDDASMRAQYDLASQKLKSGQSSLSNARKNFLSNAESRDEIAKLEGEIEALEIEAEYAQHMLQKRDIRSPKNGVVLFSSSNDMVGKPVNIGQEIMIIADPDNKELLIRVPVDAMIDLSDNADTKFYLNVNPLQSYRTNIKSFSYQASADEDGLLTYKLRAKLPENADISLGLKGSAIIYGDQTILIYALLRRPLIAIRNMLGI